MKLLRFGQTEFDLDTQPNKKEAVHIYETASFYLLAINALIASPNCRIPSFKKLFDS
jgi:hypothetical protein